MIKIDKPLVQWEQNRVVTITERGTANEIHFYNSKLERALIVAINDDDTANIPNILLQDTLAIHAWLVCDDGSCNKCSGHTVFEIEARIKPEDYIYEETEVKTFKGLVKSVEDAVSEANATVADLEAKRDSGYFNGADGYTPKRGVDYLTETDIALAKLMAKDAVKDYVADELKGPQSEIEEMRNAVASLENMIVPYNPFDLEFGTAEELVLDSSGRYYFMSADTYGDNWRVSEETTAHLATGPDNVGDMRMFSSKDGNYRFLRAMYMGRRYVFDFTAPVSRYYNLTANVVLADSGGYADIYVNNVKVGRIDTYNTEQKLETFFLGTVRLKAGEYANKIKIVPNGISGGTKCRPSFVGFSFTAPS